MSNIQPSQSASGRKFVRIGDLLKSEQPEPELNDQVDAVDQAGTTVSATPPEPALPVEPAVPVEPVVAPASATQVEPVTAVPGVERSSLAPERLSELKSILDDFEKKQSIGFFDQDIVVTTKDGKTFRATGYFDGETSSELMVTNLAREESSAEAIKMDEVSDFRVETIPAYIEIKYNDKEVISVGDTPSWNIGSVDAPLPYKFSVDNISPDTDASNKTEFAITFTGFPAVKFAESEWKEIFSKALPADSNSETAELPAGFDLEEFFTNIALGGKDVTELVDGKQVVSNPAEIPQVKIEETVVQEPAEEDLAPAPEVPEKVNKADGEVAAVVEALPDVAEEEAAEGRVTQEPPTDTAKANVAGNHQKLVDGDGDAGAGEAAAAEKEVWDPLREE